MDNRNPLEAKYGTIYTESGIGIDNMAVIINKEVGLYKYGEADKMDKLFAETIDKYTKAGLSEFADSFMLIKFDRYEGILSIEEICTFINYMIMCSANGEKIMNILSMEENDVRNEIKKLSEIGY